MNANSSETSSISFKTICESRILTPTLGAHSYTSGGGFCKDNSECGDSPLHLLIAIGSDCVSLDSSCPETSFLRLSRSQAGDLRACIDMRDTKLGTRPMRISLRLRLS